MENAAAVKQKWNKDANYALKFNKFILWPLGLWPTSCDDCFSYFRISYAFLSQLWMVGSQGAAAYLNCGDSGDVVDYVMMCVCALMAITKIAAFRAHMGEIRLVFSSALNDWLTIKDRAALDVMTPFAKSSRKVFFFQMISSYMSNTLIVIGSLPFLLGAPPSNETLGTNLSSLASRELPLKTGCMFADYSDGVYGFFYAYEAVMINLTANGNVGCDILIFTLAMHLCGQLELLKIDMTRLGDAPTKLTTDARGELNEMIGKHMRVLDLAAALNRTVSELLIVQLLLNAGINLMLGIRVIIALKSDVPLTVLRPIIAFVVMMFQLYLLSYASEQLSRRSESVVDALYASCWYELSPELRKDLNFVAMRANEPVYLTAGNFYVLNVENFMGVLKASFSYFSILRVVFEG